MKKVIVFLISLFFIINTYALENAFYILRSNSADRLSNYQTSIQDLKQHYQKIQVLIGQAYHIDQNGIVTGSIDDDTVNFAKKHHIKLYIMVTNSLFDNDRAHQLLMHSVAENLAIKSLIDLCQKNHYYGVQFDFEGIKIVDRENLTRFFKIAAARLHQANIKVSFAVVPTVDEQERTTAYLQRKYNNWSGVYDLKALGEMADFITLMSYDEHTEGTTPGSLAGIPWMEALLINTLQFVPREKISLGLPAYSSYWKTDRASNTSKRITVNLIPITADALHKILEAHPAELHWDKINQLHYVILQNHFLNEYIFIEDRSSFKAKLALIKKYHLRGFSLFDLGNEDLQLWSLLNRQTQSAIL